MGFSNDLKDISNYITNRAQKAIGQDDEFIALVSGLNFPDSEGSKNLKRLSSFLLGDIPDINIRKVNSSF